MGMRGHHRHGNPPWMMGPMGYGPGWPGGRKRARRGDIRFALLSALADGPAHGYELIRRLAEKSEGMWQPSPGSVYPTLQLLEDEGLIRGVEQDGKRVYELTEAGRAEAQKAPKGTDAPWQANSGETESFGSLRQSVMQLGAAAMQVAQAGTEEQVEQAEAIVREARKKLYQMLAED